MNLRPYQLAAVDSIYTYFAAKAGNPIVAMPTATGKSVVIAEFCKGVINAYPQQRILVATHQKELIEQNHQKLVDHWPQAPAGIFSASVGRREVAPITFVGIQTVAKKAALFGHIDLMLIDECHLVGASQNTQYLLFIEALKAVNPHLKVIGLTATPYRLGMGMLTEGGIFTDICFDLTERLTFNRLIAEGYLCPLISRKTAVELDVTEVEKQGGEFVQKQLQDAVDRSPITSAALKEAVAAGADRKHWLIFAAGLEHAAHISEMLNLMGVTCAVVSGELPKAERERLLLDFRLGKYRAVVNNNVLTTGFDFPGIDFIVMLRPTSSPGLWVQMLGRGTRILPGKANCLVLMATQSLSDAANSGILDVIMESTATKIFLPNVYARDEDTSALYRRMGLNARQIEILATAIPKRQYYYVSENGRRLYDLALGPMALAFVGASDKESVATIKSLEAKFGHEWVHEWLAGRGLNLNDYLEAA